MVTRCRRKPKGGGRRKNRSNSQGSLFEKKRIRKGGKTISGSPDNGLLEVDGERDLDKKKIL